MKRIFVSYNTGIACQDDPFHPFRPDGGLAGSDVRVLSTS